jgi:hypothetical protein
MIRTPRRIDPLFAPSNLGATTWPAPPGLAMAFLVCRHAGTDEPAVPKPAPANSATATPAYNGIVAPLWPPQVDTLSREPLATPPHLIAPPAVIPIDVGRQLFVDDFLVEATTLERKLRQAEYHAGNPGLGRQSR